MKITAEQLYMKLVNDYKLVGQKGKISFTLKDITVEIETKDTVGNLIQEWLKAWMISNSIEFGNPPHTQNFPDFLLDTDNPKTGLLEVKVFDYSKSANFDVANFMAYRRSVLAHPYRLDSNYLIIGYKMVGNSIEIADVWLKKVWEITGPSEDWPLKCQVKQGEVVNIRPAKWYNTERTTYKPFNSALEFLNAFDGNQRQWTRTQRDSITSTWLRNVIKGYKAATGRDLT
jgi:NgoBV restriction endonuclease